MLSSAHPCDLPLTVLERKGVCARRCLRPCAVLNCTGPLQGGLRTKNTAQNAAQTMDKTHHSNTLPTNFIRPNHINETLSFCSLKHKQPHVLKLFSCGEISLQAKPSDLPPRRGRFPLSLMVDDPSKAFLDTNNCLPSKNDKWGGHLKWWGTLICFARGETALTSERPRSGVSATLPARPPGTLK